MEMIRSKLILFFFLVLAFPIFCLSQDSMSDAVSFEVNKTLPYIYISENDLADVSNLTDLNRRFESSWVRSYISVEILVSHHGETMKAVSENDKLNQSQKDLLEKADIGTTISVTVQYIPENDLKNKEVKEIEFEVSVLPEKDASYVDGERKLKQYLKEKAIDKIPNDSFEEFDLAAIKFTVNEDGEIINAHVFDSLYQSYHNEEVNAILLEAVKNMSCWIPAEYANGTKVKQDFVLAVGNMESCVINLLDVVERY